MSCVQRDHHNHGDDDQDDQVHCDPHQGVDLPGQLLAGGDQPGRGGGTMLSLTHLKNISLIIMKYQLTVNQFLKFYYTSC